MLDNVMLYWATNSATSSARLYWESFYLVSSRPVSVPTGVAMLSGRDIFSRAIMERKRLYGHSSMDKNAARWPFRGFRATGSFR